MQKTAFQSLPGEWQQWITENLARACEPAEMAQMMARDSHFERSLIYAAIDEARTGAAVPATPLPRRPEIDSSTNLIHTPDRAVEVLLTLRAPRLVLLGNVLSDKECAALIDYSEARLERSPVVDDSGAGNQLHAHRTSRGAMLQRAETQLIARIDARLAHLANWPMNHGEGLQVLRYGVHDEYRAHYDWFDPDLPGPRQHLQHGGQRLATFILYLSDVERGGGTGFPAIGLEVMARKGGAVFFANTDSLGVPDRQTLHAGLPVVQGVKYIANKWLRAAEY